MSTSSLHQGWVWFPVRVIVIALVQIVVLACFWFPDLVSVMAQVQILVQLVSCSSLVMAIVQTLAVLMCLVSCSWLYFIKPCSLLLPVSCWEGYLELSYSLITGWICNQLVPEFYLTLVYILYLFVMFQTYLTEFWKLYSLL